MNLSFYKQIEDQHPDIFIDTSVIAFQKIKWKRGEVIMLSRLNRIIIISFFLSLTVLGCSQNVQVTSQNSSGPLAKACLDPNLQQASISMLAGSCSENCEEYSIEIQKNGTLNWVGIKGVKALGSQKQKLDASVFSKMVSWFDQARFLSTEIAQISNKSDNPMISLSIVCGTLSKDVMFRDDGTLSENLQSLMQKIRKIPEIQNRLQ